MDENIVITKRPQWSLPRWYHALFFVVLIAQLAGSYLLVGSSQRAQTLHSQVVEALGVATNNIQLYHLWLEEYLTHPSESNQRNFSDNTEKAHAALSVLNRLAQEQEWQHNHADIAPHIANVSQQTNALFELGQRRVRSPSISGVDSILDDTFDARFSLLLTQMDQLKIVLHTQFDEHRAAARLRSQTLLALGILLIIGIWITLLVVDRRRRNIIEKALIAESELRKKEVQYSATLKESMASKDALLKQKEKLRLHFEQTPLGVIEWTPEFKVVNWNPAAARIFGYSAEEAVGRSATGLILNEALLQEVASTKLELITQTGGYRSTNHNISKDGRIILCDWYNTPLFDHDGNTIGIASLVIDITEQKKLELSHHRLASMLENSTDFVGIADHEGRILYINGAGRAMTGLAANVVIDQMHMHDFHSKKELARMRDKIFPQVIKSGLAVREDIAFLDKEGNEIPCSCIVLMEVDEKGAISHYMVTARDLREEKLAQSKLEHTQRLESLGVLAGGIAHDFNNILTSILGNTALASNKLEESSPISSYLHNIEAGSQRAAELCKQMLAYSGKGKFVVAVIDMNQMVEEITRLMEVSIHKGVVLKFHLAENLPMIEADAAQLQQIMMNLIINASESIEGKSGVVSLSTGVMSADASYLRNNKMDEEVALPGRYVYLEVSDTGSGMNEKTQRKLFDPFFTTKFTGRGLGMSAVLGIVRGHKGTIKCYSEQGKGSTFKVLFPCSDKLIPNAPKVKQSTQVLSKLSGTALIVDDEQTIQEVAGMILEEMGFTLLKASDGEQGVALFRQHQEEIKLVLLDMTMPKMDGVEAFREIQRIRPGAKVILSSGYNEQDATNRFAGKGLAGFIQKPYLPNALQKIVRDILNT